MTLNLLQVAERLENVVAAGAGNSAFREQFQCTDKSRTDVSAGSMDLTLGVGTGH
jgi:hypothetical protein